MNATPEPSAAVPAAGNVALSPGGNPPAPSPNRRRLGGKRIVAAVLILAAAAGGAGWRYHITRPDYRLARGEDAIRRSDWTGAGSLADRLAAAGNTDHAHLLRAEVFYARQSPESALAECDRVRDPGPLGRRAANLAGKCLLDLGALGEADRVFNTVLGADPDDADAHRGVAAAAYELGQTERVVAHLEEVIRLDPGDARPHRLLGEVYRDAGDLTNAVAAYQEALRIGDGLSDAARDEARFELADALVQLSRYAEGLQVLDEAAVVGPEPPYMQALRVESLRGLGRRAEAGAEVDRALAAHPDAPFYRLRGQLYLDEGNATAAIPLLEKAANLLPRHYQTHFLLARAYAAGGRKADADRANARVDEIRRDYDLLTALSREAVTKPWEPSVRLRLAEYFQRTGDPKLAAMWRKAAAECQARRR